MLCHSISELVGNTPMLELTNLERRLNLRGRLLVKLESRNPAGSAKDRIARHMLDTAEEDGTLKPGGTVIEPTSGNTGIGLAAIGASRGYRVIIIMPDTMSVERQKLIRAYGAELVLTPGALGMAGCLAKAEELRAGISNSIIAGQFTNPANPEAHYLTTGPEIWADTEGRIDCFTAGIGTGGTISGTGKYLKEKNPAIRIAGVEPKDSPLITEGHAGPHGLQGIGANFIPDTFDREICDEILTVTTEQAYEAARLLGRYEGILAGISSGAALSAAITIAGREDFAGKTVAALLPDTGERYLSTDLFQETQA